MRRSIALFVTACALPLVILGAAFWAIALMTQQTSLRQLASDRAHSTSMLIGRELVANLRAVQMVTQSPAFDGELDDARFAVLAQRIVADEPAWRVLSVADTAGRRLLDVPRPIAGRPGGTVVDLPSLQATVRSAKPIAGQVVAGPRGRPAFAVRAPVVRAGEVRYVVSAVVDPQALGRLLTSNGLPAGWRADIFDGRGGLVYSTAPAAGPARPEAETLRDGFFRTETGEVFTTRGVPGSAWTVRISIPGSIYGAPGRQAVQVLALAVVLTLGLSTCLLALFLTGLRRGRRQEVADAELLRLEALGRMTGGVAHDFNNLLTPILGGLDLLQRRLADDPRAQRLLEGALLSAERAQTLVARLLAFARRQSLQTQDVDLASLLDGLADLIRHSVGSLVTLELRVEPGLPAVRVDPGQLELAILNLAVNARDAMPLGGTITLAATLRQGGQGHAARLPAAPFICVSVADTGQGMDPAVLRQAIDPFFTTKPVGKGTGLGLSMVDGLAAQSGGALVLTSAAGVGTTAEIWLPTSTAAAPTATEAPALLPVSPAVLLLVDDDDMVRAATAELLADAGHTVVEAGSVTEAVRTLKADRRIEALITDYAMPARSGAELIHQALALRPGLPVLLITGYAGAATDVPDEVPRLAKPFRRTGLLNAVGDMLRRRDLSATA